jgi:hypothetical protein
MNMNPSSQNPTNQQGTMTSRGWLAIYICTKHMRVERDNSVIVWSCSSFSLMWVGGLSAAVVVVPPSTLVLDSIATATSYLYLPLWSRLVIGRFSSFHATNVRLPPSHPDEWRPPPFLLLLRRLPDSTVDHCYQKKIVLLLPFRLQILD